MSNLKNFVTSLHQSSKRNYVERMVNNKVDCMIKAKEYNFDYWDGDRKYGYGGYKYLPGRWKPVAESLIREYNLGPGSKVLDVGCGKGYLLYEMLLLQPDLHILGFDISEYAIENSHPEVKEFLFKAKAEEKFDFKDKSFDLVISLGCIHNLNLKNVFLCVKEVQRVGKNGYIMLESYRNDKELFNLQCWALTCETFLSNTEWEWLYNQLGYTGDYEFIYFE
ncbi:class I SAM-dependent methyltransferase [Pelagibacteraceae bacterium]|nr:class I SAM-dependent methyltransferase [Pelagibacteraceae bacterium]